MLDANLPLIGPNFEGYLNEVLPHCDLGLPRVGARYEMIPEDAQCSVSELQNRLAAEHSQQKGLERIIWMPRGLVVSDERQIDFVRYSQ